MMSVLTDADVSALMEEIDLLQVEDEERGGYVAWTWLDVDLSVAWDSPDSYHGKLAELYQRAGWERCYHRDHARFHYNVKVSSNASYQAFQNEVRAYLDGALAAFDEGERREVERDVRKEIDRYAQDIEEWDLRSWWDSAQEFVNDHENAPIYSCGRSGGYLNCSAMETSPHEMVKVAQWLSQQVDYYRSAEYGIRLAQEAIDAYREERLAELASPRGWNAW